MVKSENNALVNEFVPADIGPGSAFVHLLQKVNIDSDGNDFLVLLLRIKFSIFLALLLQLLYSICYDLYVFKN